ncbi:MAG: 23S rRNA (guanosine(2251)-2'-O)-methyltransferase RlmB [Ignavibacteria bacterium GWA2_35_9]|nr:MAG: 23S rRNA (guanosine(2251)-2'-O)-methyltransferase RlmB [Ignavibacteria bacterium GWA2_35_9]OGU46860.1 MAG: 23S rRNA (guanosine(2251)-2'-O)-methyltransferase RlmB [Ignavibacteria bacterium GWB2_36_8]
MSLLIGRKPVLEAINSGEEIDQVYILYGQQGGIVETIRIAAKKKGIKCNLIPLDRFRSITNNPNAQGVAAKKSEQKFYQLEEIVSSSKKSLYPLLLILDSIQNTHNVGAIIRTAECCGVDGIIFTKHNSAPINETVVKTSAGATEHIKLCQVTNLAQALLQLKEEGYWIIGSSLSDDSKVYTVADYKIPVALILGNEEKGIRKLTINNCDLLIKIPMMGKIQSLNVSVSAGIILFEILRQRSTP